MKEMRGPIVWGDRLGRSLFPPPGRRAAADAVRFASRFPVMVITDEDTCSCQHEPYRSVPAM